MPRVKTEHDVPAFAVLPTVDLAHLGRTTARYQQIRALLPAVAPGRVSSEHARRHVRLQALDQLLQDPEIAALAGVPTEAAAAISDRSQRLLRLAASVLPQSWGAEEGRLLCAGALLRSSDQLFTAVGTIQRDPRRSDRERDALTAAWLPARQALIRARALHLRGKRRRARRHPSPDKISAR